MERENLYYQDMLKLWRQNRRAVHIMVLVILFTANTAGEHGASIFRTKVCWGKNTVNVTLQRLHERQSLNQWEENRRNPVEAYRNSGRKEGPVQSYCRQEMG
jgi:hypothetical protein